MKTSNFANNRIYGLKGISISRFPDKRSGFTGPEFTPLMPSEGLLKSYKAGMSWESYQAVYKLQLECLNPELTYRYLCRISQTIGAKELILLCYESAKTLETVPCHRRLVAEWFEEELGLTVPEWVKQ